MATTSRERTIRWEDPARWARAFANRSGLEIARAIAEGSIDPPPMAVLMDLRFREIGDGIVRFTMQPAEYMCNPLGFVHGGALETLLDTVLNVCVYTKLAAGASCTTTDMQLQFVRPILPDGPELIAQAEVVYLGKARATSQARVTDSTGRIYAHGTAGLAILDINALTPR
jgi:uncharacterized protein (TIGR00369 family)